MDLIDDPDLLELSEEEVKEDYAQAITDFDKAIQLNPKYAEAYFGRGKAYGVHSKQAIIDIEAALQLGLDEEYIDIAKDLIESAQKTQLAIQNLIELGPELFKGMKVDES